MILVLVETDASGAVEVSREAISFARDLAAAGGGVPVDAVVVGELPANLQEQLAAYGVRTVHHAAGEAFDAFSGAAWAAAVQAARAAAGSVVVTAAGTPRGNEVLAHVAARTGVAMAANVLSFSGLAPFVVTRQVVGGAALEEMRLDERPAVFTVAGHAVEPVPAPTPGPATVTDCPVEVGAADLVARVVSTEEPEPDLSGSLKSARVVIGAGRGAGSADGFADLLELTDLLGRLAGRLARRHQPRLAAAPRAGRPDRQPDLAGPLRPVRHQRRDPALGGVRQCEEHPRDQHRPRRPDGHQGDVRRHRGPARGGPRDQRRDPPAVRLGVTLLTGYGWSGVQRFEHESATTGPLVIVHKCC